MLFRSNYFLYCDDDPVTLENLGKHELPMQTLPFSVKHLVAPGAGLENNWIKVTMPDESTFEIGLDEMKIQGMHNAYNAMAAIIAGLVAGVAPDSIRQTLRSFGGVEHRLEPVGEVDGVLYINDSKATNVDSVWYALESMTRRVIWIAGGTDKGNDYEPLQAFARQKVKALVTMGVDNAKLVDAFSGVVPRVFDTHSLADAMLAAEAAADPGDVVLLSPACASFDLFKNYEDRGNQFKQWVNDLISTQTTMTDGN